MLTLVVRDGGLGSAVRILISKVDCAAGADVHPGIAGALQTVGNLTNTPGNAIVCGHDYTLMSATTLVWHIHGAVRRDHRMPVQAAAFGRINWHTRTIGESAVIAP